MAKKIIYGDLYKKDICFVPSFFGKKEKIKPIVYRRDAEIAKKPKNHYLFKVFSACFAPLR